MFLSEPTTDEAAAYLESDRIASGFTMNHERAWAWRPDIAEGFARLRRQLLQGSSLSGEETALLSCATAHALGDPSCSIAWGTRLATARGIEVASAVLHGANPPKASARESALRSWAAKIVDDPNEVTAEDVETLRTAGLSDREILEATVHVAFRLAFSTVNDALGALPDHQLVDSAPAEVRAAVSYGRPAARNVIAARSHADPTPTE
jgi:uncharacterized peroxidase-related enzyme